MGQATSTTPSVDGLLAALDVLRRESGTAALVLKGAPFSARVVVSGGQVLDVAVGDDRGPIAFKRALVVEDGHWVRVDAVGTIPPVSVGLDSVIKDAVVERRLIHEMTDMVGGREQIWTIRYRVLKRELPLIPDDVNPLLRLLDGTRTVARVLVDSPFEPVLTLRILQRLLSIGVLILPDRPDGDDSEWRVVEESGGEIQSVVVHPPESRPPTPASPTRTPIRPLPALDGATLRDDVDANVEVHAWSQKRQRPPAFPPRELDDIQDGAAFVDDEPDLSDFDDAPDLLSSSMAPVSLSPPPVSSSALPVSSSVLPVSSSAPLVSSSVPPVSSSVPPVSSSVLPVSSSGPTAAIPIATVKVSKAATTSTPPSPSSTQGSTPPSHIRVETPSPDLSRWLIEERAFFSADSTSEGAVDGGVGLSVPPSTPASSLGKTIAIATSLIAGSALLGFLLSRALS